MGMAQQTPPSAEEGLVPTLIFGGVVLAVMLLILWRTGVLSRRAFAEAPARRGGMGLADVFIAVGLWFLAQTALVAILMGRQPAENGGGGGAGEPGALGEAERMLMTMGLSQLLMLVPVGYVLFRAATVVEGGLAGFGLGLPRPRRERAGSRDEGPPPSGEIESPGQDSPAQARSAQPRPTEDPVRRLLRLLSWILLGTLAVIPLVFAVGMLVTVIATLLGDRPPAIAHGALRVLAETPPGPVLWGLIASAVLVAPLLEEILFRGLLQTALLQTGFFGSRWGVIVAASALFALVHLSALQVPDEGAEPGPTPPEQTLALAQSQSQTAPDATAEESTPDAPPETEPEAAPDAEPDPEQAPAPQPGAENGEAAESPTAEQESRFAWQALPVLFILSLGLGCAYERTGSLWVPIGIHALFNGVQVAIVLSPLPAGG